MSGVQIKVQEVEADSALAEKEWKKQQKKLMNEHPAIVLVKELERLIGLKPRFKLQLRNVYGKPTFRRRLMTVRHVLKTNPFLTGFLQLTSYDEETFYVDNTKFFGFKADLDYKEGTGLPKMETISECYAFIASRGLPEPTFIIQSNTNNFQPVWLFDNVYEDEDFLNNDSLKALVLSFNRQLSGDSKAVWSGLLCVRAPGAIRYQNNFRVKIEWSKNRTNYNPNDLQTFVTPANKKEKKVKKAKPLVVNLFSEKEKVEETTEIITPDVEVKKEKAEETETYRIRGTYKGRISNKILKLFPKNRETAEKVIRLIVMTPHLTTSGRISQKCVEHHTGVDQRIVGRILGRLSRFGFLERFDEAFKPGKRAMAYAAKKELLEIHLKALKTSSGTGKTRLEGALTYLKENKPLKADLAHRNAVDWITLLKEAGLDKNEIIEAMVKNNTSSRTKEDFETAYDHIQENYR